MDKALNNICNDISGDWAPCFTTKGVKWKIITPIKRQTYFEQQSGNVLSFLWAYVNRGRAIIGLNELKADVEMNSKQTYSEQAQTSDGNEKPFNPRH